MKNLIIMKKLALVLVLVLMVGSLFSQNKFPLIGAVAPSFEANTTNGMLTFPDDFGDSWKILFSHPRDFTPVCTSEALELARMQDEFEELNTRVAIISTDDVKQHERWKESIESIEEGLDIRFPIIDDFGSDVSRKYGMVHQEEGELANVKDVRGVFFIDPDNIIQAIIFYPMKVGRNMKEVKRALIALQSVTPHRSAPVNWNPGDDFLVNHSPYLDPQLEGDSVLISEQYYNIGIMWYKRSNN